MFGSIQLPVHKIAVNNINNIKNINGTSNPIINTENNKPEKTNSNEGTSMQYNANMDVMLNSLNRIKMNEDAIKKIGCPALLPLASSCKNKGMAVINGVNVSLKSLNTELNKIMHNQNLSQEEIEEKIALINAKQEAIIKEAETKIETIEKISDLVSNLVGPFMQLKGSGIDTNTLTEMIKNLLGSINTAPSSLSDAKNAEDVEKLSKKNIKNIFGEKPDDLASKYTTELDKKIDKAQQKLNNQETKPEEKNMLKIEISVYNTQKKFFNDLFKQFSNIK